MANNLGWEIVKEFYQKEFGIDGWVIEMYANFDILILCASGASNETIEKFLEIPIEEVVKVIEITFDFRGWDKDLPINPYKMFCNYDGKITSVEHFLDFDKELDIELSRYSLSVHNEWHTKSQKLFYLCETMYDIERKIQDEWI